MKKVKMKTMLMNRLMLPLKKNPTMIRNTILKRPLVIPEIVKVIYFSID